MVGNSKTYSKGMEALLSSSVPYFVSKNTILKSALLCQESSPNGGFFVGLEFIGDLVMGEDYELDLVFSLQNMRTNRRTTDDFPTAASPI